MSYHRNPTIVTDFNLDGFSDRRFQRNQSNHMIQPSYQSQQTPYLRVAPNGRLCYPVDYRNIMNVFSSEVPLKQRESTHFFRKPITKYKKFRASRPKPRKEPSKLWYKGFLFIEEDKLDRIRIGKRKRNIDESANTIQSMNNRPLKQLKTCDDKSFQKRQAN